MKLSSYELQNVKGGFSFLGIVGIATGISFLVGIVDGIIRPNKCK